MASLPKSHSISLNLSPNSKNLKKILKKGKEKTYKTTKSKTNDFNKASTKELKAFSSKKELYSSKQNQDLEKTSELASPKADSFRPSHVKGSSSDLDKLNYAINNFKSTKKDLKQISPRSKKSDKKSQFSLVASKFQSKRSSLDKPLNKANDSKIISQSLKQEEKVLKTKNLGTKLKEFEKRLKKKSLSTAFEKPQLEKSLTYKTFQKEGKPLKSILSKGKITKNKTSRINESRTQRHIEKVDNEESIKSSRQQTENDEWINIFDHKFQGGNSKFVEEFKEKIRSERIDLGNLNEAQITLLTSQEDLCTEDLDLTPSDSISIDFPYKINQNIQIKKPDIVPSLQLNFVNLDESASNINYSSELIEDLNSGQDSQSCKSSGKFIQSTTDPSLESVRVKIKQNSGLLEDKMVL